MGMTCVVRIRRCYLSRCCAKIVGRRREESRREQREEGDDRLSDYILRRNRNHFSFLIVFGGRMAWEVHSSFLIVFTGRACVWWAVDVSNLLAFKRVPWRQVVRPKLVWLQRLGQLVERQRLECPSIRRR